MTYEELVEKARNTYGKADAGKIKEHVAIQFNVTGEAEGIFYLEIADGKVNIGDSAIMRWAINNTCVKTRKDGNKTYEKIEPKLRKNDPFMAFVVAMSAQELLDEEVIYV